MPRTPPLPTKGRLFGRPDPAPMRESGGRESGMSSPPSRFFHDGDGVPQDGVDVEIGRIENVSIRRRLERRNCAFGIAFVAAPDIREDRGLVCNLAEAAHLERATLRPYLGRSRYENLDLRAGTDDRPDVAAVENGARPDGGKILLQLEQRRSHLRNGRDHRG